MARSGSRLTVRFAAAAAVVMVVAVAAAVGVVTLTNAHSPSGGAGSGGSGSGGGDELNGYTFVYHPGTNVTVVKQSFTTNTTQLTFVGPNGSVAWDNASGGATNMVAEFDYRTVGARPGDGLAVRKRFRTGAGTQWVGNSTVPDAPQTDSFVVAFHQNPAVTVVNVHGAPTGDLELAGPYGAVAWDDASLGASPSAATFSYNRHAIGATAGDTVSLVRVQGGTRTTVVNATIP